MPCIGYISKRFQGKSLAVIDKANTILEEYDSQGFVLTLRQLYYQFVARGYIPNRQSEYKKLGSIINDARLAGYIDWLYLEDRTRNLQKLSSWDDPSSIIASSAQQYHRDLWDGQDNRVEVWIEKDALVGVIENICDELDVPFFSCRGYTSQSEMWRAAQRLLRYERDGQQPVILHFGDHDPSGMDMSRDIEDRLTLFDASPDFIRVALNTDQVEQYNPPPNPTKITDSRAAGYIAEFGYESWELDALEPRVIAALIRTHVDEHRDIELFEEQVERMEKERLLLLAASSRWSDVEEMLEDAS
jgi:hypothetical protein